MKHLERYEDFSYHSDLEEHKETQEEEIEDEEASGEIKKFPSQKGSPIMCYKCYKDTYRLKNKDGLGKTQGKQVVLGFG